MKRIITVVLAFVLVLSFTACGGKDGKNSEKAKNIDFNAVFAGTSTFNLNSLSEAEQQDIVNAGSAAGVTVTFLASNDVLFVRDADAYAAFWNGSEWSFIEDYGKSDHDIAAWPDDEFTRQIPKPGFDAFIAFTYGDEFTATFRNVTKDMTKAYVESVKAADFTIGENTEDKDFSYAFTASNGKGYGISVKWWSDNTVYVIVAKE